MSLRLLLNKDVSVTRKTDEILEESVITPNMTVTRQPDAESALLLTVSSMAGVGGITVSGLVDAVTTSEVFSFTEDGFKQSSNEFTSVSGISTSGFTSGKLKIQSVTPTGQPLMQEKSISTSLNVRFTNVRAGVAIGVPGVIESEKLVMIWEDTALQHDDIITDGSDRYILGVPVEVFGLSQLHHYEAFLKKEGT